MNSLIRSGIVSTPDALPGAAASEGSGAALETSVRVGATNAKVAAAHAGGGTLDGWFVCACGNDGEHTD